MIKDILIVEDEMPNADRLRRLLNKLLPGARVLSVEDSVTSTVAWLAAHKTPDLVMLDVRLADGLSFEIFSQVSVDCPIIFTTAYDEYAVRAFKYNSVDYLLKPVEEHELEAALKKVQTLAAPAADMTAAIEGLRNYFQPRDFRTRFLLPYRDSYRSLLVKDISFFYSEMGINRARLADGSSEVIMQTLEELEAQLDPKLFFRANRQFIVHIDAIGQIHNHFNGKLKMELKKYPDIEIIVSRDKGPLLKTWMDF